MVKLSLSNEILIEIGKITVIFSLIEASLAEIIAKIVTIGGRRRELGTIVTAELSFKQRVAMLDSLLLFLLGKDHDASRHFALVKPKLAEAEENRNKVVHSMWMTPSDSQNPHAVVRVKSTAKQKSGLRTEFHELGLDEMRQIADLVGNAYGSLCAFEFQFGDEPVESELK